MKYLTGSILFSAILFSSVQFGWAQTNAQPGKPEVNVALSKWGATATASSIYGPGYEASNVLDGRWSSRETDKWNSASGKVPHWLLIDLGAERVIDRILIRHEGVYGDGDQYNTADFRVQKANTGQGPWIDLVPPVKGNTDSITVHNFEPVKSRYIRLLIDKGAPDNNEYARIFEVEVYSEPDGIVSPLCAINFPSHKFRKVGGLLETQSLIEVLLPEGTKMPDELMIGSGTRIKLEGWKSGGQQEVWIPASADPVNLTLSTGRKTLTNRLIQTPMPLNWGYFAGGIIHVIASSHNDIAWFDTPAETIARRDHACITPALKKMEDRQDISFCMEDVLYLLEYLDRHPEKREEINRLTTNGQFDWGATYNQPYEGLLSGEQLVREVYYGKKLISKMIPGASAKVAYNPDVPGRAMQMPQILAKAGIPYLLISRHKEGIFNWKSPDGTSVLAWSMSHYGNMISEGVLGGNLEENSTRVKKHTDAWAADYAMRKTPAHFAFLHSADYIPPANYDKQIAEWESNRAEISGLGLSKEFNPPKLKYSSPAEFFDAVSVNSTSLESITGERPDLWLYIHGPTHHLAISAKREAGVLLPAAETFAAVDAILTGSFNNYPSYELGVAWQASIYDDHGWGGKNGEVTDEVFKVKLEFARDKGKELLNRSIQNIAARVKTEPNEAIPVVVFNALSWMRSDPVNIRVKVPFSEFRLEDAKGQVITVQSSGTGSGDSLDISFIARDVPSLGYKTFYIKKGNRADPVKSDVKVSDIHYENQFYSIELSNGGIRSLVDRQLGQVILSTGKFLGGEVFTMQSVGNGAGEFSEVQQPTMEGFDKLSNHSPQWFVDKQLSGPVRTVFTMEQKLGNCTVSQKLIVYNELKRIDCEISLLNWDGTKYREFRMALPINMDKAGIAYEVPMGVSEVGISEIAGSAGGGYGSLDYSQKCTETRPREVLNFISASDSHFGVTMSSSVAVCDWVDPTSNPVGNPVLQPILLASRKSCHWEGNWYLQPGDHHYSFSILSHKSGWKNGYRFGIQANNPLRAVVQDKPALAGSLPGEKSFFSVSGDNTVISAVKKCEDDNSVVTRIYDIGGKDSQVRFDSFFPLGSGEHTNIIEEQGKTIPVSGQSVNLQIGHQAIETYKLFIKR
ncbi:MAG: discoidin domain-containing protein [Bacteroidales bacterium]|jgi:alpha-mannosidase